MMRAAIALLLCAATTMASAQDFEGPWPGAQFESAAEFLEFGLPPSRADWVAAAHSTGRHAIPVLTTRALTMGIPWRALRGAVGLSQTGDPEIGWTVLAAGVGVVAGGAGFGVRGSVRRDRWWLAEATPLGEGLGAEAGIGLWARPTQRVDVWAAAPHIWLRGSAPPLERGLHVGLRLRWSDMSSWVEQDFRGPGVRPAVAHGIGLMLAAGPAVLWASARDAPLRASVGVQSGVSWVGVAAEAESHPVLGETLRLAVRLRSRSGRDR